MSFVVAYLLKARVPMDCKLHATFLSASFTPVSPALEWCLAPSRCSLSPVWLVE